MIKKIIYALIFCCFIASCGKKGDPVYKDPKKEATSQNIFKNKAS